MGIKFSNLASTTLASSVTSSATSISVADGSVFPALGAGDYFYATIDAPPSTTEIVKVTARSGDTLTVVRAQDNTTATTHASGDSIALRVVSAVLEDIASAADTESVSLSGDTMTGNLAITAASSPTITLTDTTNTVILKIYSQDAESIIGTYSDHPLVLFTDSTRALTIDGNQSALFAGNVDATGIIKVGTYAAAQLKVSGYSSTYRSIMLGAVDNNGGTVSLAVDISSIAGSNFAGQNQAYIGKNGLLFPNNAADNWIGGIARGASSDVIHVGPATTSGITSGPLTLTSTDATFAGHVSLADSKELRLGGGDDLKIYHDGSNSYVKDAGTGDLYIAGSAMIALTNPATDETYALFNDDGSVVLKHDNSTKFSTSSSGISVTGTVTATGTSVFASLDISGDIDVDGTTNLDNTDVVGTFEFTDGGTSFNSSNASGYPVFTVNSASAQIGFARGTNSTGTGYIGADANNCFTAWDSSFNSRFSITQAGAATFGGEVAAASLDISGNVDIDGTTNLDVVDIDGAVQIDNTVTVGVDDTGYDVKFFGSTASAYMLWDESADDLILAGAAKLGVGTAPDARLHVQENGEPGGDGTLILEANSSSRQLQFTPPSNAANGSINIKGGNLVIKDDGTEIARFQGSTSFNLNGKLQLYTTDDQANYYAFYTHTDDTLRINYNNAGNDEFLMTSGGNLSTIGTITASQSNSDIRLKENIQVIPDAVSKVKSLRGVTFNFKESGEEGTGLIAQEVQEVLPEAVYTPPPRNEGDDFLALHYGNTVGLLVEAIKEQQAQIEALIKRIEGMED